MNDRRKLFIEFMEKDLSAKRLEGIFLNQELKAKNSGKISNQYSGMVFRKLLESNRFDYVRENHIAKNVKKNAGSVMEYLIARDIKELENHKVDNKKGVDIEAGRWDYEIKAFTCNSSAHGYKDLSTWISTFTPSNKQLLFSIDRTVYQMSGKELISILPLLKFKEEHKKKELRIAPTNKNFEIMVAHSKTVDTVALD